jgi:hypothetical protein
MKIKDRGGFSAVAALLIIVLIGIIGGTGWYVMQANKKTNDALNNAGLGTVAKASKKKQTTPPPSQADPTANWIAYSSKDGNFSLKYPSTWKTAMHPEACATGVFMLGAEDASVGKCGTENFGQMTITWRNDRTTCGDLNSDSWTINSKETVMVSGKSGVKQTATAKSPGFGLGAVPEGTKTVQYCFVANDATYIANYTQLSTYPDVLSDFNLMVTKTLKFSS